jgi:hypothetical protein
MSGSSLEICYVLVLVVSIGFMIWGFIELLRQPKGNEVLTGPVDSKTGNFDPDGTKLVPANNEGGFTDKGKPVTLSVVSRQLRGFALIMLAQIILVVGMGICSGLFTPSGIKTSSARR